MSTNDRLARAKKYLAIAESRDAKREAYKAAAEEIAAHKAEAKVTWAALASALGRDDATLRRIDQWRRSGYKAETPFLMDGNATTRASRSHTKKIMRESSTEEIKEILDDLPDEVVEKVAQATEGTKVERKLYPDKPKPTHKKAAQKAKAKDTATLEPWEAVARLGAVVGTARAGIRAVVKQYQEFLALVDDEDYRDEGRERVVGLRADADLALGEVLEGSFDQALARLLSEEVQ